MPLPTDGVVKGADGEELDPSMIKHKLSMLEGAVIGWTKQVCEHLLRHRPSTTLISLALTCDLHDRTTIKKIREAIIPCPVDSITTTDKETGLSATEHLTPDQEVKLPFLM